MTAALRLLARLILIYGGTWWLAFSSGLYFLFPWDRVRDQVAARASALLDRPVDIGAVSPWRLTGLQLNDVAIRWAGDPAGARAAAAAAMPKPVVPRTTSDVATVADSKEAVAAREAGVDAAGAEATRAAPVHVERLAARLRLMPLLLGVVSASLQADALGGEVSGTAGVRRSNGTREIDIEFAGLELGRLPMWQSMAGLPVTGVLSGAVDLRLDGEDFARSAGLIELRVEGLKLGKGKVPLPPGSVFPFFDLETPTDLGTVDLAIQVGAGEDGEPEAAAQAPESGKEGKGKAAGGTVGARVVRFEHEGADVSLKLDGDITLVADLGRSRPNLDLQLKPAAAFVKRNALSTVLQSPRVKRFEKDGWIGLSISGTVTTPRPTLRRPVPPRPTVKAGTAAGKPASGGR